MKRTAFPAALLILGACSWKADQIYTVDEHVAGEALPSRILREWRNNPGELRETANC